MTHQAVLTFEYPSASRACRVERAVGPAIGDIDDDRSRASLSREGSRLLVTVTARDAVALRASLNTWQSLVAVAERAGDAC